ncbi:hypothetical protein [Streptomyces sioyaensis]|uniref:hypothetical protein n=1 Tax=Streptomyces sioyaensis TaxID=67364 RepID=UPI001EF04EB0|nr:hypothetical protein [Streptomyces sioyaensis]
MSDRLAGAVAVLVGKADRGMARSGQRDGVLGDTVQRTAQIMIGTDRHHRFQELRKARDRPARQRAQAARGAVGEISRGVRRLQGTPLTFRPFGQSNSVESVLPAKNGWFLRFGRDRA